MPGTPDPVLGSEALTFTVACSLGALVAAVPYGFRKIGPRLRTLAVGGGLAYGLLCVGMWGAARIVTDAFVSGMTADAGTFFGWTLAAVVVLGAQAAIPYYCYARWRLVAPLAVLFAVTVLVSNAFLAVHGESDPLGLYVLVFGPMLVAATVFVGVAEFGVRHFVLGK